MKTLYVTTQDSVICKSGECLEIRLGGDTLTKQPLMHIDSILAMGRVQVTAQALQALTNSGITIVHTKQTGRIVAITSPFEEGRCDIRLKQYGLYMDNIKRLEFAKAICENKIRTQEEYLRERRALGWRGTHLFRGIFTALQDAQTIPEVLGVEGKAANLYFHLLGRFSSFTFRSRRPAKDGFNALLNLGYSLVLARICSALLAKGLDLQLGFLHSIKTGRPSLALDAQESFRTDVDRFIINLTNRRELAAKHFSSDSGTGAFSLTPEGFGIFFKKYHQCLDLSDRVNHLANRLSAAIALEDAALLWEQ